MKNCTFRPSIDKKSAKLVNQNRGLSSNKSYEVLFNKHSSKMENMKKLIKQKEDREVAECTFAPQLRKARNSKLRPSDGLYETERRAAQPTHEFSYNNTKSSMRDMQSTEDMYYQ